MLYVAVARSFFDDAVVRYVVWMTSRFHIMGHIACERREDSVTA